MRIFGTRILGYGSAPVVKDAKNSSSSFFRRSKILGEVSKQEFYKKCSENSRSQIVFRTDIFGKLTLGAPDLTN